MNKKELKKKIRRLSKENHTKYYDDDYGEDLEIDNDKEIERLKRILEGFQKGKLEQKKEEFAILKKFIFGFHKSNFFGNLNCECSDCERLFKRYLQLRKEIEEEK